jgi:xanthine/CO dehydrogenase XdhC/CoxF family maturation factor
MPELMPLARSPDGALLMPLARSPDGALLTPLARSPDGALLTPPARSPDGALLESLSEQLVKLERDRVPHCLATVVAVRGSASAKPGSKMLVSGDGKNLSGWVGGGCAESFTIANALEALSERRPRTITADLDDEVFGLGMPCGGQMDIFLEPRLPPEELVFSRARSRPLAALAEHFGFAPRFASEQESKLFLSGADCVRELAGAIAGSRGLPLRSLCGKLPSLAAPAEFLVLGHSRITEELAKLGVLAGWKTRVYGLNLDPRNYPAAVRALEAQPEYAGLDVREGSFVVVASHHKGDHHYLAESLRAGAAYVGLVASRKRTGLVLDHLRSTGFSPEHLARVHAPAGLELECRNPGEIALSIVAELLGTA